MKGKGQEGGLYNYPIPQRPLHLFISPSPTLTPPPSFPPSILPSFFVLLPFVLATPPSLAVSFVLRRFGHRTTARNGETCVMLSFKLVSCFQLHSHFLLSCSFPSTFAGCSGRHFSGTFPAAVWWSPPASSIATQVRSFPFVLPVVHMIFGRD